MQAQVVKVGADSQYPRDLARAAELLKAGKLIALPTETVYGIAGVFTHPQARSELASLRPSPGGKPLTLHVPRPADALAYIDEPGEFARRMMRKLWPGPVGLTFHVSDQRREKVAKKLGVEAGMLYDGSNITLRCPDHPVFTDLAGRVAEPLALVAPGQSRTADLPGEALAHVEMVFDAGETRFAKPSTLLRVKENGYEVVRAGVYDQRIIDRLLRTTLLFVCSGNTCRSPMAETIARSLLAEKLNVAPEELEAHGYSVTSAGTYAMAGARATPQAVDVMQEMGLDLSRHRSRPLTVELIHEADAIYAMGRGHARAVTSLVPAAAEKVSTLDPQRDIEDPIGGDRALYAEVAERIKALLQDRLSDTVAA